jgi:endonuclease YncB( thermonuclease family)
VDGDTLRIEGTSIRLLGLDAVELDQTCTGRDGAEWPCGREARAHLAALVDRSTTMCVPDGRDRYGRVLARCSVGDEDVGDSVVRGGWALAEIEYGLALADARLKGRGIWAGAFIDPAQWRRDQGADGFDLWGWLLGWLGR